MTDVVFETATTRYLRNGDKMPNWDLSGGLDKEEYIFLAFYAFYMILMYILYWRDVMKPMKLLAVFVHEMVSRSSFFRHTTSTDRDRMLTNHIHTIY